MHSTLLDDVTGFRDTRKSRLTHFYQGAIMRRHMVFRPMVCMAIVAAMACSTLAGQVSGELKKWHKVTLTFDGPQTHENATPNPFMDFRLNVRFTPVAAALKEAEDTIAAELLAAQGSPVDLGGYYLPDPVKTEAAMRPSKTLNTIIDALN